MRRPLEVGPIDGVARSTYAPGCEPSRWMDLLYYFAQGSIILFGICLFLLVMRCGS